MSETEFSLRRKLANVGFQLVNARTKELAEFGVTLTQYEALRYLRAHPGSSISQLKAHFGFSHQAAGMLLERMRAKGLVEAEISSRDSRARSIQLTRKSEALCQLLEARGSPVSEHLLDGIGAEELEAFAHTLDKLYQNLKTFL